MKTFRVAVCFSGMARIIEQTLPRHDIYFSCQKKDILKKYGYDSIEFDYFFYFSNYIYYSEIDEKGFLNTDIICKKEIDSKIISLIKNNQKTKKYFIEENFFKLKDLVSRVNPKNISNVEVNMFRRIHQFYSAEQSNMLKKQYELENNFKYDMSIRFRTDLFVFDDLIKNIDHKIHLFSHFLEHKKNSFFAMGEGFNDKIYSIGDLSSYSDSTSADTYYNNLTEDILNKSDLFFDNNRIYIPEEIWGFFLKERNLRYKPTQFGLKVLRSYEREFINLLK